VARWLPKVIARIHELAAAGRVSFTGKAIRELEVLDLGFDEKDVRFVLEELRSRDFSERLVSEHDGAWMYVFRPRVAQVLLYLKVVLRSSCVVVSFHEEGDDELTE
jgi:hypothetical protein